MHDRGRFAAAASRRCDPGAPVIDCGGRPLMPGPIEAHAQALEDASEVRFNLTLRPNHFNQERHLVTPQVYKHRRLPALTERHAFVAYP
jgi:hypothetical protein